MNLLSGLWLFLQCFPEFQLPSIPQKWFALPSHHSSLTPNSAKLYSIMFKLKLKFLDFLFVSVIKVILGIQSSNDLSCTDSFRGLTRCFRCTSCDWQWITRNERQIFLLNVETFPTGSTAISNKYCRRQKKKKNKPKEQKHQSLNSKVSGVRNENSLYFAVVDQLLSCVRLFETSWTATHPSSLSFTTCWSLL